MARRKNAALKKQLYALGAFAIVILGVLAFLFGWVIRDNPAGEFVEGVHYTLLERPAKTPTDKVEVTEFFSYACIHCFNFDPGLADWVADNADKITFKRSPVFTNEGWRVLGTHYFTTQQLGILEDIHYPFFFALHDTGRSLYTQDDIAKWIDGRGVSEADYLKTFRSAEVRQAMTAADRLQRRLQVATVPTIVVAGKYRVGTTSDVGPKRMLEVMDHLVAKEAAARAGAPSSQ